MSEIIRKYIRRCLYWQMHYYLFQEDTRTGMAWGRVPATLPTWWVDLIHFSPQRFTPVYLNPEEHANIFWIRVSPSLSALPLSLVQKSFADGRGNKILLRWLSSLFFGTSHQSDRVGNSRAEYFRKPSGCWRREVGYRVNTRQRDGERKRDRRKRGGKRMVRAGRKKQEKFNVSHYWYNWSVTKHIAIWMRFLAFTFLSIATRQSRHSKLRARKGRNVTHSASLN